MRMLAAALLFGLLPIAALAAGDPESVLVATAPVQQGTLDETLIAYGMVQAAPDAALMISVPYAGAVLRLRVLAGQRVRKGDPLFDYGTDPAVSLAYQQAVSALTLARSERAHTENLFAQKLATQSQLDQANKAALDAQAAIDELRRLGSADASVTVTAPFAGVVASVSAANGDHVQANAAILQLAESARLEAVLGVAPEDSAALAAGMAVALSPLAHPGPPLDAKISAVGGAIDAKTQLIDIVVPVAADPGSRLLPGEQVSAAIAVGRLSGWIVPRQAVLTDRNGAYVFQVNDGKAARVMVTILGQSGDQMAVGGAIDASRKLVVSGNYELSDGMHVQEQASPPAEHASGGAAE